ALHLRETVQFFAPVKDPVRRSVDATKRHESRGFGAVGLAGENEGRVNARLWVVNKLDNVRRSFREVQIQCDVLARENFAIVAGSLLESAAFEPGGNGDGRWWCGDKYHSPSQTTAAIHMIAASA